MFLNISKSGSTKVMYLVSKSREVDLQTKYINSCFCLYLGTEGVLSCRLERNYYLCNVFFTESSRHLFYRPNFISRYLHNPSKCNRIAISVTASAGNWGQSYGLLHLGTRTLHVRNCIKTCTPVFLIVSDNDINDLATLFTLFYCSL